MTASDVLMRAWSLIEPVDRWTTRASARNRNGQPTAPDDPEACCWCVTGAVERIVADLGVDDAILFAVIERLGNSAEALFGTRAIGFINDREGHEAVRRLFEHALAQDAIIRAEGLDEAHTEIDRLSAALQFCLGHIDHLQERLQQAVAREDEFNPLLSYIKHAMCTSSHQSH